MHFIEALTNFQNSDLSEFDQICKELEIDQKALKLRLKQLKQHYFSGKTDDVNLWTDIPLQLREKLHNAFFQPVLKEKRVQNGDVIDNKPLTVKTLWELKDGEMIESVLMHYPAVKSDDNDYSSEVEFDDDADWFDEFDRIVLAGLEKEQSQKKVRERKARTTLCISSQVGCAMGCPFCATGMLGLKRNLSLSEIVEQVRLASKTSFENGWGELTNIVFMGEGEPTANAENVLRAVELLSENSESGFGISASKVTISTVGIVDGINKLTQSALPFRLALSLHAPTNELRNKLVPTNRASSVEEVLAAAFNFFKTKGKRVSIEYALMGGINDSEQNAFTLAKQLNRLASSWAHVNLIALNEVEGSEFHPSTNLATEVFLKTLISKGIVATLRNSRGQDIDAACGQLAAKEEVRS